MKTIYLKLLFVTALFCFVHIGNAVCQIPEGYTTVDLFLQVLYRSDTMTYTLAQTENYIHCIKNDCFETLTFTKGKNIVVRRTCEDTVGVSVPFILVQSGRYVTMRFKNKIWNIYERGYTVDMSEETIETRINDGEPAYSIRMALDMKIVENGKVYRRAYKSEGIPTDKPDFVK